jgi:two-component system, NarL family, response regulator NreC
MSAAKPSDAVAGRIARHSRDRRGVRSPFDEPKGAGPSATIVLAGAPEASTDLTAAETDRLVELEQAVDRGLQTFVEVGQSLAEIRDRKLYRASYDTFERYCRERWGFTRQRARQFIDAAAVTTVVVKAGLPAPANEAQARELVPLRERPDELETAWRDTLIVATAAGRSPWAELVRQTVIEVKHRDHPSSPAQALAAVRRPPDEPIPADTERAVVGAVERVEQAVTAWEQLDRRCGRLARPLGAQTGMALLARLERIETSIAKLKAEIVQKLGEGADTSISMHEARAPTRSNGLPRPLIRVVIADDHAVVRRGLRQVLDAEDGFEVLAEASDLDGARRYLQGHHPDVLVLDLNLPGGSSLGAISELRAEFPDTQIVVLTMEGEPRYAREALSSGALGYVLKEAADSELVEAVRRAAAGDTYLNPRLGARVAADPPPGHPDGLSEREVEVLRMIALGHTNSEIAEQLYLSVRTVETHRAHIQQKLRRDSRSDLVRYALEHKLIETR